MVQSTSLKLKGKQHRRRPEEATRSTTFTCDWVLADAGTCSRCLVMHVNAYSHSKYLFRNSGKKFALKLGFAVSVPFVGECIEQNRTEQTKGQA